jgi:hypothetical protein
MLMYAEERLLSDTAYIAHHLHWSLSSILDLEHHDREFLLTQIDAWSPAGEVED